MYIDELILPLVYNRECLGCVIINYVDHFARKSFMNIGMLKENVFDTIERMGLIYIGKRILYYNLYNSLMYMCVGF